MALSSLRVSLRDIAIALVSSLLAIIAFASTFFSAQPNVEPVNQSTTQTRIPEPVTTRLPDPDAELKLKELKAELLSAKSDLELLQEQRTHEWEQTALLVDTLLEAGDSTKLDSTGTISDTLQKLHRRFDAESDEFFGPFDDLVFYAVLAGLRGPSTVQEIANIINDSSANLELRQLAYTLLYFIPSETSLKLILEPPQDLASGEDMDPDLGSVAMILDTLPAAQVTPYLPTLYEMAMSELEHSPQDDQGWSLLGVLALNHRYPPALDVLNRPRNFELFGDKLLEMAWWIGTDESRSIIERLSREHPQPEIREKAAEILAGW